MLLVFSREYLKGEGDIMRHLRAGLGYSVVCVQPERDEYDYNIANLSNDLKDAVILVLVQSCFSILVYNLFYPLFFNISPFYPLFFNISPFYPLYFNKLYILNYITI